MMLFNVVSDNYSYLEGNKSFFSGRLGMRKIRIPDYLCMLLNNSLFDLVYTSYALNRFFFCYEHRHNKQSNSAWYTSRYARITSLFFRDLLYSVTFGYAYRYKFESRLFRSRFKYTSFVFRLGIAHKVNYCLPFNLRVKENDKKNMKDYHKIVGMSKRDVIQTAYLFRSFRVPDMYSRLGIFVKGQYVEFREGIKRLRV